jgi:hypothetical protein
VKRLGLAFKFGFIFPVGGSVPVLFISMLSSISFPEPAILGKEREALG